MFLKRECADGLLQSKKVACVSSMSRVVSGWTVSVLCISVSTQAMDKHRYDYERHFSGSKVTLDGLSLKLSPEPRKKL